MNSLCIMLVSSAINDQYFFNKHRQVCKNNLEDLEDLEENG